MKANRRTVDTLTNRITDALDILKLIEDRDGEETELVTFAVLCGAAGAARRILSEAIDDLEREQLPKLRQA